MFVPAVLAADLLLAMSARDLGAGLLALLLWGRVLPALAGLGRGKVNWKVPPMVLNDPVPNSLMTSENDNLVRSWPRGLARGSEMRTMADFAAQLCHFWRFAPGVLRGETADTTSFWQSSY